MPQISDEELEKIKIKSQKWIDLIKKNRTIEVNVANAFIISSVLSPSLLFNKGTCISCDDVDFKVHKKVIGESFIQLNAIRDEIDHNYDLLEFLITQSKDYKSFEKLCNKINKEIIIYCNKHDIQTELVSSIIEDNL